MNLSFLVNGTAYEMEIPEWQDELSAALEQLHESIVHACGDATPAADLGARLYVTALHALVEQCDLDLGEIVAGSGAKDRRSDHV